MRANAAILGGEFSKANQQRKFESKIKKKFSFSGRRRVKEASKRPKSVLTMGWVRN